MRQTSQAVALLLALDSAQAASESVAGFVNPTQIASNSIYLSTSLNKWQYATQFNTYGGNNNNQTTYGGGDALTSRTAPYNRCGTFTTQPATTTVTIGGSASQSPQPCTMPTAWLAATGEGWKAVTPRLGDTSTADTTDGTTVALAISAKQSLFRMVATSGTPNRASNCVECLQAQGVWCSRTFSYQTNTTSLQVNASTTLAVQWNYKYAATGTQNDNGSCCGTIAELMPYIQKQSAALTALPTANNNTINKQLNNWACAAFGNNINTVANASNFKMEAKFADSAWGTAATVATTAGGENLAGQGAKRSWWCSNGLYNLAVAASNNIYNVAQTIGDRENNRQELALVGCPQISSCGASANLTTLTDNTAGATGATAKATINITNVTPDQKCTYVLKSKAGPPAFKMLDPTTGTIKGVYSDWQIHHMEYNDNQLPLAGADYIKVTDGIAVESSVPLFVMPNNLYSKQRTWYGVASTALNAENWNAPYNNGFAAGFGATAQVAGYKSQQSWGYVASFVGSTAGTDYDSAATATWDSRQIRFFPAQIAVNSNALGAAIVSQYGTAKTAYDTAKTNWDNYVAILTKNAKVDAFAAAFSPPKAPTVPPLPNKPWLPSATTVATAMSRLPPLQVQLGNIKASGGGVNVTGATQPTAANFWTSEQAALVAGGWGSFTAATIKYRNGWGKSFGTIGYSDAGTTGWNGLAQVYNQQWQCSHSGSGSTFAVTPSATTACPATYTAIAGTLGTAANNTVNFYVALSVWAVKTSATGVGTIFGTSGTNSSNFSLEFTIGTWSSALQLAAPGAMAAATAASSLTGVAGAHALAASAAAALATAAALY